MTFVAIVSMCCAHIGGGISYQDLNPQVYCGRTLARALALLCFDEGGYDKRSEIREQKGTMFGPLLLPYHLKDQEPQLELPWVSTNKARSMSLPSRGKRYPGVVNECCDKPCSINELLTYC
ncbi:unnamed protein product [Parnassius apollo]|uniref:(apollo) hypothetical protein n=1 Tax=Parnassius apollo TaxID=110799 RepID=A0A8S3WYY0_PARAO|nr:unnamed protein product [Parnassius apollo]